VSLLPAVSKDSGPAAFFDAAYDVFLRAEEKAHDSGSRFYSIGGYSVRLRLAGAALAQAMTPALEHLTAHPCASPSLTICLWDSVSTRSSMPAPPWALEDYSARGEVRNYTDERILTACHKSSGALSILDRERNLALWWIRDASEVPFYERGSPLLTILDWWMQRQSRQVVHAAAVGVPEAGVLLAGKGGSGKSTTAFSCLDSDLHYVGDDYCLLTSAPVPHVFSLYNSGKLDAGHLRRLPHLLSAITNRDRLETEKALLFFKDAYPGKIATGLPVQAIFLPRITGRPDTSLTPTSSATGLKALAPSTLFQLSCANHRAFSEIAAFCRQLPCYYLELGTELRQIPQVISNFLSKR
jgi:hypothetical protein